MIIKTYSTEETIALGERLGKCLEKGDVVTLNGDLGAGKTHFTKGIAKGLNVDDYITSPTFTIVNEHKGRVPLYHFDVYRIDDIYEMYEIGFEEYLYGEGVCIVEWSDKVKDMLPKDTIDIIISVIDDNTREFKIISKKDLNLN